jgi:hypothetical protein
MIHNMRLTLGVVKTALEMQILVEFVEEKGAF